MFSCPPRRPALRNRPNCFSAHGFRRAKKLRRGGKLPPDSSACADGGRNGARKHAVTRSPATTCYVEQPVLFTMLDGSVSDQPGNPIKVGVVAGKARQSSVFHDRDNEGVTA